MFDQVGTATTNYQEVFSSVSAWLICVCVALACVLASLRYVHMLQLESYQGKNYMKWLGKRAVKELLPFILVYIAVLLIRLCSYFYYTSSPLMYSILSFGADFIYVAIFLVFCLTAKTSKAKKPLVYTGRVVRLLIVEFVLAFLFAANFFYVARYVQGYVMSWGQIMAPYIVRYLPGAVTPLFIMLAFLITYPVEELIKRRYFLDAKKRLAARPELIKIGITGSYGKTSTKFALATILSEKYNVLHTPGSYNTTMGVTRVIREQLKDENEVFIAEMGARYKGDIAELCELVEPKYGIITSVGKQHLESFKTIEQVIRTKAELAEALPADGVCVLNGDNEYCRNMADGLKVQDVVFFGEGADCSVRISDISVGANGSTFTLNIGGDTVECGTKLLGRHNIMNIAAAAALADKLGLTGAEIAEGIAKIEPVEHRLQIIEGAAGSIVIDDAFNANPEGAREAMEVIKLFTGRKIVVTPGMVELGDEEAELNREFGKETAAAADVVMLVGGAHTAPVREGLIEAGFDESCIVDCATLDEAAEKLKSFVEPGSVTLFLNDLPDNYNE